MTTHPNISRLNEIVYRYAEKGIVESINGTKFICPLMTAPLAFLHRIFYDRETGSRARLNQMFGFPVCNEYIQLMSWCNGADLFDNSFFIFGISQELKRGLGLEDQRPISLQAELNAAHRSILTNDLWQPFASVTGYADLYSLSLSAQGEARIALRDGPAWVAASILDVVIEFAVFFDRLSNEEGLIIERSEHLDIVLADFIYNTWADPG